MTKLSRVLFPVIILIISTIIILNSCSKDNNPPGDECNIVIEDNLLGKLKSDFGNYVILKPDSTLWTWGFNSNGQLGNGTTESSDIPRKVPSIEKIIDFDMYEGMAIAVDCTGNIWFWGSNMISSIFWPEILSPVKCSYLNDIKAIEIYYSFIHMLRNDGTVWRIKIEPDVESSFYEPEIISNLEQIVSISQSIALMKDCTLCELKSKEPEHGGLVHVKDVVAVQNVINRRTVILKKDGTVWFWGFICKWDENHNPIGINIPERINDLDNVALIYAGPTCLAMRNDGSYWYFKAEDRIPQLVSFE